MTGIGRGSGHVHCWAATECRERAGRRAFMAGVVLCVALGVLAAGAVTAATALPLRGPAREVDSRAGHRPQGDLACAGHAFGDEAALGLSDVGVRSDHRPTPTQEQFAFSAARREGVGRQRRRRRA